MVDIGYKNFIEERYVQHTIKPDSSWAKWLRKEAIAGRTLIDCTQGKKTSSLIILKTGHVVLTSIKYSSLIRRLKAAGVSTLSTEEKKKGKISDDSAEDDS